MTPPPLGFPRQANSSNCEDLKWGHSVAVISSEERGHNGFPMLLRVSSENQPVRASVRFGISNDSRTGR